MGLIISDIDFTITKGQDIWEEVTRTLVIKPNNFESEVALWKDALKKGLDPIYGSFDMMQRGISSFFDHFKSDDVYKTAYGVVYSMLQDGLIRTDAIEYFVKMIHKGHKIVLSTANYTETAHAVVDVLVDNGLLTKYEKEQFIVSGSIIDFNIRRVLHINVAQNKVVGLLQTLNISFEELQRETVAIFGDDPIVNDRYLLNIKKDCAYVITTPKNKELKTEFKRISNFNSIAIHPTNTIVSSL